MVDRVPGVISSVSSTLVFSRTVPVVAPTAFTIFASSFAVPVLPEELVSRTARPGCAVSGCSCPPWHGRERDERHRHVVVPTSVKGVTDQDPRGVQWADGRVGGERPGHLLG